MGRDTDRLRIISMRGSGGRGRQFWEFRPNIDGLVGNEQPDMIFLPGDDPGPSTTVVENYSQLLEKSQNGTVLLYDHRRLSVKHQNLPSPVPHLDNSKLVFPSVDIKSPAPSQSVVKRFHVITWQYDLMKTTTQQRYENGQNIMLLSQLLAKISGTEVLIGGDLNLPLQQVKELIKWLNDLVNKGIETMLPLFQAFGYMDCMTRNILSPERKLRQLRLHKVEKSESYYIASKEMQLMETKVLPLERLRAQCAVIRTDTLPSCVTEAPHCGPRPSNTTYVPPPRESCYSTTQMYIPQKPPKHHGG